MLELYQLPISHYCEKIRWALDYKKLDYKLKNLLPGLHISTTTKLTPKTSVPVIVHDGTVVYDSSKIISYLDETFPEHPLTPSDPTLRDEALAWERFADNEIGEHVRRIVYHTLLDYPNIVVPFYTVSGPWYGPLLIRLIFPKLRDKMRRYMKINDEATQKSLEILDRAIDKAYTHMRERRYFVGESFSRADLAMASLMAPLCSPEGYGLTWPAAYPEPLAGIIAGYAPKISWVNDLYNRHRQTVN